MATAVQPHFLDTTCRKFLAVLPDFGGCPLRTLESQPKNEIMSIAQKIYLRTLMAQYSLIGCVGASFFTGMLLYVATHDAHHMVSVPAAVLTCYPALAFLARLSLFFENRAALSQLRASVVH